MNPQQPAFVPVPWMYQQPVQQQTATLRDSVVPSRARAALDYLMYCTRKEQPMVAIGNLANDIIPGQPLTVRERYASGCAANVLADYFRGEMKMDMWEQLHFQYVQQEVISQQVAGRVITCINCGGATTTNCEVCKNKRRLLLYPIGSETVGPAAKEG